MNSLFHHCALFSLLLLPCPAIAQQTTDLAKTFTTVTASANAASAGLAVDNSRTTFWSGYHGAEYFGQEEYVELGWDRTNTLSRVILTTKASGDTLSLPTKARLAWWDGTTWQDGPEVQNGSATIDIKTDITTQRLRICLTSATAPAVAYVRIIGTQGEYDWTTDYKWPDYPDVMNYDFRKDYPNGFPAPTKMLPENNGQVGMKHHDGQWWAFAWGKNRNHYVTDAAIDSLLNYMDWNFRFFREQMGWLPDKRAKNGYYSTIYLFGSGLYSDSADSTQTGGWQGATWYNGESWPMVNLSYYPVACFDNNFKVDSIHYKVDKDGNYVLDSLGNKVIDYRTVTDYAFQQGACVHEGIHAMLADLDGCKKSVWFHESSDNWLMSEAAQMREGTTTPTSMGFLSAASVIAPFMPIDCYSGWLQDGSFGGPTAEGVNLYNGSQQICTWRNLLGGVQYSEYFPNALSQILGNASIPWIWQNCRDYILGSMGKALGDESMRSLLVEYNARRAMVDVGKWNTAINNLLDNNWGLTIQQEWAPYKIKVEPWTATCYANMSLCQGGDSVAEHWWKPEYRTTPGWSAANQIPIHVRGTVGNVVKIYFKPLGKNMVCQLAYRTKRGRLHYGHPVSGEGLVGIELKEAPANNVVFAIVSNTDYEYKGEETRTAHYDYRLRMLDNAYQPADAHQKWYKYRRTIVDRNFDENAAETGINELTEADDDAATFGFKADKTVVNAGETVLLSFSGVEKNGVQVRLHDSTGRLVYAESLFRDGAYHIPSGLKGLYIMEARQGAQHASQKIIVK